MKLFVKTRFTTVAAASALTLLCATPLFGASDYSGSQPQDQGVGDRVGHFFRKLFYGEPQQAPPPPAPAPPSRKNRKSTGDSGFNLDRPPQEVYGPAHQESTMHKSNVDVTEQDSRPSEPRAEHHAKPSHTQSPDQSQPDSVEPPPSPKVKHSHPKEQITDVADTPPAPKPKHSKPKEEIADTSDTPPSPPPRRDTPAPKPPKSNDTTSIEHQSDTPTPTPPKLASSRTRKTDDDLTVTPNPTPSPPQFKENTPPPSSTSKPSGEVLTGTKIDKPGRVKSPYPPYNELDVAGLPSGSLAMDPTTQRVFRVP